MKDCTHAKGLKFNQGKA